MKWLVSRGVAKVAVLGFTAACSESETPAPDSSTVTRTGEQIYAEPQPDGNSFACSTCHALNEPAADGFRRPGHPIANAPSRPNFKNGEVATLLEAVNSCLEEWMASAPWTEESEELTLLTEYLKDHALGGPSDLALALSFEIVAPPVDVSGGDPDRGHALFNQSCAICHGMDAVGTERALPLVGDFLEADYIAQRVRLSGSPSSPIYEGLTGGRMPFWAADRLDDDELRDLIAFILGVEGQEDPGMGGAPNEGNGTSGVGGPPARDCPATHEKIGQTAEFVTRFHDVAGTAEIVDDCTITVHDFVYDGTGVVVEMYSGTSRNFLNGFAVSGDLRRSTPYAGETLTLTLPEGKTLDDFDSLSVWCVDVAVSFGDAMFE